MRKPRRGATLLELIVVGSVFFAFLTALWMIYGSTVVVERNVSLKADLDREIFAAVRHVDAALKTCRLTQPSDWYNPQPVGSLELTPLSVSSDGQPILTAQGFPQFGDAYTIVFLNGELGRPDTNRKFANLGSNGQVSFRRPSQGTLEMSLKTEKTGFRGQTTARALTFQFSLFNQ